MPTSRVLPRWKTCFSRGGTRPFFGSRAVRSWPELWLCAPTSRSVGRYRKKASTVPKAKTVPVDLSARRHLCSQNATEIFRLASTYQALERQIHDMQHSSADALVTSPDEI